METFARRIIIVWLFSLCVIPKIGSVDFQADTHRKHDFRHISYQELQQTVDTFSENGITTYSQLLFDVARNQVLVGARDVLYRLSLPHLKLLENATWQAPMDKTQMCLAKGQSEENCHNYIKVLLTNGRKVFACGTESFSPSCTWREIESINTITDTIDGIARCPYSPSTNSTALLTENGDYYIGGPTDFSGSDFAIYKDSKIRTKQYDSMWLNEPQFVGSFETDKFVYFVFREAAVEYINCGKIIYSRIARVCKKDAGGQVMLKDNWTTFIKARLNCSVAGQYPFYYNEIQGLVYAQEENLLYATFTTGSNSIAGSAVCAFNMSAINDAFSGPFKYQEHVGSAWSKQHAENPDRFECSTHSRNLIESSKYHLMDNAVQATTLRPLYEVPLERFTHISVDVLATKQSRTHVVFVATQEGTIKKLSVSPRSWQTCLVEVWNLVPDTSVPILNIQYLKETNSVYVGTQQALVRITADHCNRHRSKHSCLNAMDPYCGWNEMADACTTAPNNDPSDKYWLQSTSSHCPILNAPVDGGWSSWSDWHPCVHLSHSSDDTDECMCRTRSCTNPGTRNGGRECTGNAIAVTNCTLHGGWTAWSAWSECSATCGVAVKTRTRTCTNPAPAYRGRVCVGQDRSEVICTGNPPCPVATPTPQDGGWSEWDVWSMCTQQCGRGFRTRQRRCNNPPPLSGGLECTGTDIEYEECSNPCPEQRKTSTVSYNSTNSDGHLVTRKLKFTCRAPLPSNAMIHLSYKEIFCKNKHCHDEMASVWGHWGEWSRCNVTCGSGMETRERRCEGRDCRGHSMETRECRVECTWGCWSDWSPCSTSCGWGIRKRYRSCVGLACVGEHMQEEQCESSPCGSLLGWGKWTVWSECDGNREQHRKRNCNTSNHGPDICQGASMETRMCFGNKEYDARVGESITTASSMTETIVIIVIALIAGLCVGMLAMYYWHRYRKKQRERIPSSPHYMSTKLNPYITVPYHDRHAKRNLATTSNLNNVNHNNGTIKSLKFDMDTLKRNSNQNNANSNAKMDVFEDKYYE